MTSNMYEKPLTADAIIKRFQTDEICYDIEGSEISKFYAGKNVFLTGGTGFLGKLLLEKLLRTCPDVATFFVLVRPKKGKDTHTRIDELFNDEIFQKLSKLQPKFRHKIVLVGGDLTLPGLGMSIEDRQMIMETATIFVHIAATVKFHEKLNLAVDINVKGTKEMLTLAKESKHVDCFVHISTAFSHCYRDEIGEKLYDVPYDGERITQICNATPPQMLEKVTPDFLGKWPNTYVFTKAIAEDCIAKYANEFPICIVRPSVVMSTYKEPIKSWTNNIYGATGIVIASGLGILRAAHIKGENTAEIVPADMVINCIIAASCETAIKKKSEVEVYNFVSSPQNAISWDRFMALNAHYGLMIPTIKCLWIYSFILIRNRLLYVIYAALFHTIPAILMDLGLLIVGKKPQMVNIYKKIHHFGDTVNYFTRKLWNFENNNTRALFEKLSDVDKRVFDFDISKLNWEDYFCTHCLGLRIYLMKDDLSTVSQSKKRYFRIRLAHIALKFIGLAILLRLVYGLVSYLFF